MKLIQVILSCGLLASSAALAQDANPITIRVAHGLSDDSHLGRSADIAAEQIKRRSNGHLIVKVLGKAVVGSDTKAMEEALAGNVEIFIGSSNFVTPIYKPLAIWETPFLFANYAEADAMLDGKVGRNLLDGVSEAGLIGLAFWENGFRSMTNNVRPITRVEDFSGIRLRTMPSQVSINTFKRLDVDAKPLPFNELRAALEHNVFDGQENPLPTIVSARIHEVQKFLTITNHTYTPYGVMAAKKWWMTLSAADQKIIRDAFWDTRIYQRQESRKAAEAAMAVIKNSGVKVSELAVGERARIANRLERVIAQIAGTVGLPLWIELNNDLNENRAQKRAASR